MYDARQGQTATAASDTGPHLNGKHWAAAAGTTCCGADGVVIAAIGEQLKAEDLPA